MVVIGEVITTEFGDRMQLVILGLWKSLARGHTGTVERVIRIVLFFTRCVANVANGFGKIETHTLTNSQMV